MRCARILRDAVQAGQTDRFPRIAATSCVIVDHDSVRWQTVKPVIGWPGTGHGAFCQVDLTMRLGQARDMRIALFLTLALVALSACDAGLSTYYRPGVSVTRMQSDTTRCDVAALKDAPVANQVRQRAPIYYPGSQYCTANGCYYRPGYWVDGGFYTVDVNQDLRSRVRDMCMAEKGYQPVNLPACSASVKAAAPPQATRTLPPLTGSACVIRYDDDRWQIVNPVTPVAAG